MCYFQDISTLPRQAVIKPNRSTDKQSLFHNMHCTYIKVYCAAKLTLTAFGKLTANIKCM